MAYPNQTIPASQNAVFCPRPAFIQQILTMAVPKYSGKLRAISPFHPIRIRSRAASSSAFLNLHRPDDFVVGYQPGLAPAQEVAFAHLEVVSVDGVNIPAVGFAALDIGIGKAPGHGSCQQVIERGDVFEVNAGEIAQRSKTLQVSEVSMSTTFTQ